MDEQTKAIVTQAIKQAVKEALCDVQRCNSQICKDRCGVTHIEHAQAHEKIDCFFQMLADTSKSIRGVIIKVIITGLIGAAMIGFGIKFKEFL